MVQATVNLGKVTQATDPTFAGVGSSTFGRLVTDATQAAAEKSLDARYFRIPVRWDGSKIVSSASGANNLAIEAALKVYYSWPGVRMILVVAGRTGDWSGYQNGDAQAIATRLKTIGLTDLTRFDFSGANEPDLNGAGSISDVGTRCIQIANELAAAGASGKVWGPVWSNPGGDFASFGKQVGAKLGGIDWHSYPGGAGTTERSVQQVFSDVLGHGAVIKGVRSQLASAGLPQNCNIDEFNWSWQMGQSPPLFTAANTVMLALGYCVILSSGGRCMTYATQNGELSVMADSYGNPGNRPVSSPMPAYWGIAALTGAGMPGAARLFPHYKDSFYATTTDDTALQVFAVNNESGGFNIIVINTSETASKSVSVAVTGGAGAYDVFQTVPAAPYDAPKKIVSAAKLATSVSLSAPALSVSVIVLNSGASVPTNPTATAPSVPTTVTGTTGDATATLNWAPPTTDGGSPITGYSVSQKGSTSWGQVVPATGRSQQFTLLANGSPVVLSVAAINAVGTGPATSITVTPGGTTPPPPPPPPPPATLPADLPATATASTIVTTLNKLLDYLRGKNI